MNDPFEPDNRSKAMDRRDQALRRVGHMRRWVIGSSAALTAGFAVFVAEAAHGRSASATARSSSATARPAAASEPALPAVASPRDLGLHSPDQVPQAAPSTPQPAPAPQSAPAPASPAPSDSSGGGGPAVSGGS
jgi:hypothetical protein